MQGYLDLKMKDIWSWLPLADTLRVQCKESFPNTSLQTRFLCETLIKQQQMFLCYSFVRDILGGFIPNLLLSLVQQLQHSLLFYTQREKECFSFGIDIVPICCINGKVPVLVLGFFPLSLWRPLEIDIKGIYWFYF